MVKAALPERKSRSALLKHIPFRKLWPCRFRAQAVIYLWLAHFTTLSASAQANVSDTNSQKIKLAAKVPHIGLINNLGYWIWDIKTYDNQYCKFWRTFDIPKDALVDKARLVMTADNEFTLYLDGRELGRGVEWRELYVFDLAPLLQPGRHILAIQCFNGQAAAGMILGLQIDLAYSGSIQVKSDKSWSVVPDGVSHWEKRTEAQSSWRAATIIAPVGANPWKYMPNAVVTMPPLHMTKLLFWQKGWFQLFLLSLCGCVILVSLRLMAQVALHKKERLLLRAERARIARDIHDDVGARMTQLVLRGELAQCEMPTDSNVGQQMKSLCEEARSLLSTMDEILWAVNPQRDTLRDFAAYVCKYAQEFLAPTKIQCLFDVAPEISVAAFDMPLRRNLLMAIKETLNNAVKHSAATELHLKIDWQEQWLVVVVQDNGKGFDLAEAKSQRNGLNNIIERMHDFGGHCRITSQPNQGCRVELSVPLRKSGGNTWDWIWNRKKFGVFRSESKKMQSGKLAQYNDPTKF